jgi:hypothetical protein
MACRRTTAAEDVAKSFNGLKGVTKLNPLKHPTILKMQKSYGKFQKS